MTATALAVAAGLLSCGTAQAGGGTVDAPLRQGDAVPVDEDGDTLDHGGSATAFSLRLPDDAACPGDSQHEQWRVQSFLVPEAIDPAGLRYDLIAPAGGADRFALYDLRGNPYVQQLTQPKTAAGAPGRIAAVSLLSFGVFPPGTVAPGTYRIGVACTLFRETARYWDTTIVVTENADDAPAKLRWRLASAPTSVLDEGSDFTPWVRPLLLLVAAAALLWFLTLRRRGSLTTDTPRASTDADRFQETS